MSSRTAGSSRRGPAGPSSPTRRSARRTSASDAARDGTGERGRAMSTVPLKDEYLLRQKCYVGGAWSDADDGRVLAVHNPATGEQLGTVPRMGAAEARRAI